MPNHVYSKLTIETDNKDQLDQFLEVIGEEFDFAKLHPRPTEIDGIISPVQIGSEKEIREDVIRNLDNPFGDVRQYISEDESEYLISKYGANNWYDWCILHWGTKWGLYDVIRIAENSWKYRTAWSPAKEFFLKVSRDYPDLEFVTVFADEGGEFVGGETYCNGAVVDYIEAEWDNDQGIKAEVGIDFDDG